jgi:hypothetical protein
MDSTSTSTSDNSADPWAKSGNIYIDNHPEWNLPKDISGLSLADLQAKAKAIDDEIDQTYINEYYTDKEDSELQKARDQAKARIAAQLAFLTIGLSWNDGYIGPDPTEPGTRAWELGNWPGTKNPATVDLEDFYHADFATVLSHIQGADDGPALYDGNWQGIYDNIVNATQDFQLGLGHQEAQDGWKGKTHDAAIANITQSLPEVTALANGAWSLAVMNNVFNTIIDSVKHDITDQVALYVQSLKAWPEQTDHIKQMFNGYAQRIMTNVYAPAIKGIAAQNPAFTSGQTQSSSGSGDQTPPPPPPPPPPPDSSKTGGDRGKANRSLAGGGADSSTGGGPDLSSLGGNDDTSHGGGADSSTGGGPDLSSLGGNDDTSHSGGADSSTGGGPGLSSLGGNDASTAGGPDLSKLGAIDPSQGAGPDFQKVGAIDPGQGAGPDFQKVGAIDPGQGGGPGLSQLGGIGAAGGGGGLSNSGSRAASPDPKLGGVSDPAASGIGDPSVNGLSGLGMPDGAASPDPLGGLTGGSGGPAGASSPPASALQGLSGLGQSASGALSPLSDAMQQAMNGGQPGDGGPPEGVLGLGPKGLNDVPGAGGGGGPTHAGGSGGGTGGGGGIGPHITPPIASPVVAANADHLGSAMSPTGMNGVPGMPPGGAAGGGSPGGGSPGGGQRGPNGKEHKPNKDLRDRKNGKAIIGDVDTVVAVIGEDGSGENAAQSSPQPVQPPARRDRFDTPVRPAQPPERPAPLERGR